MIWTYYSYIYIYIYSTCMMAQSLKFPNKKQIIPWKLWRSSSNVFNSGTMQWIYETLVLVFDLRDNNCLCKSYWRNSNKYATSYNSVGSFTDLLDLILKEIHWILKCLEQALQVLHLHQTSCLLQDGVSIISSSFPYIHLHHWCLLAK